MLLSADSRQSPRESKLIRAQLQRGAMHSMTRCAIVVNLRISRLRPAGRDARFS
jgi:hypothetical protein